MISNTLKAAHVDNPFPHATKEIGDVCTQATLLRNIILKKYHLPCNFTCLQCFWKRNYFWSY